MNNDELKTKWSKVIRYYRYYRITHIESEPKSKWYELDEMYIFINIHTTTFSNIDRNVSELQATYRHQTMEVSLET